MEETTLPQLSVSREEAEEKIQERITEGQKFLDQPIDSDDEYEAVGKKAINWSRYNIDLLSNLFESSSLAEDYKDYSFEGLDYGEFEGLHCINHVKNYEGYVRYKIYNHSTYISDVSILTHLTTLATKIGFTTTTSTVHFPPTTLTSHK